MKRDKSNRTKQGPPVQFRPGVELEEILRNFATKHGLELNVASKVLVALAVTTMDCRYFPLINEMAEAKGGANAFVRTCVHLLTALETASRMRPEQPLTEAERVGFVYSTIESFLAEKGLAIRSPCPWPEFQVQVPALIEDSIAGKIRRKVRKVPPEARAKMGYDTDQPREEA